MPEDFGSIGKGKIEVLLRSHVRSVQLIEIGDVVPKRHSHDDCKLRSIKKDPSRHVTPYKSSSGLSMGDLRLSLEKGIDTVGSC